MAQVVAVAYSGGRDSTALLHATACAARGTGLEVVALHVHHGLLPEADGWVVHGRHTCERWAADGLPVRCVVEHITGRPKRGQSVEEWARSERYAALAFMARDAGASLVLLAHHRRDQAETFLLQAMRGAGVNGLSAMGNSRQGDGIAWVRPWLQHPREAIVAYVAQHRLDFVEDPSNADARFDRNRLRRDVWPALVQAFPNAESSLGLAAQWCQLASRVLEEVAADDLARCSRLALRGVRQAELDLTAWKEISTERRNLALRTWVAQQTGALPPASLIERLCDELPTPGSGRWPVAGGELRRFRKILRFHRDAPSPGPVATQEGFAFERDVPEATLSITRAGRYGLPGWGGVLVASPVKSGGVPLAWLAHLELRERTGGEQFQAGVGRPARSLKKQYQAARVPAWERDRGPLVFSGGQLVFVPSLGVDARLIGLPGQPQLTLAWEGEPEAPASKGVNKPAGKR